MSSTGVKKCLFFLLGLIIFSPASAFISHTGSHNYHRDRLQTELSPGDDDLLGNTDSEVQSSSSSFSSKYDDGDPRQALEQFGSLFSQVQAIATEGGGWTSDELEEKTQEFVRTYLRVFIPGIGYAATSFAVFASSFSLFALALAISGHGYTDILSAVSDIGPLRGLLEKVDSTWGNAAISLIGCDLLSPVILSATLALTPKTMDVLRIKQDEWGWGEDDIDRRTSEILNLTKPS